MPVRSDPGAEAHQQKALVPAVFWASQVTYLAEMVMGPAFLARFRAHPPTRGVADYPEQSIVYKPAFHGGTTALRQHK